MKVPYPAQELESAWKHTCFNQFHDIIAGVSTNSTYPEVRAKFAVIKGIAEGQRDQAIQVIARGINTKDLKGISVVVFNPLGWRRSDVVKVWLPAYQLPKGKLAVAHNVPSMGYKTYSLQAVEQTFQGPRASRDGSMENQFFRSKLDMKTGNLASLKLKQGDIELIPKGKQANVLLLQNEDPKEGFMSSWNIRPIGKPWHLDKADNVLTLR
jgi:alpha-mannosidase